MSLIDIIFKFLIIPMLILFGLMGNMFSFMVFLRKKMSYIPGINIYLELALFDSFNLVLDFVQNINLDIGLEMRNINEISCKFISYLTSCLGAIHGSWCIFQLKDSFQLDWKENIYFELFVTAMIIVYNFLIFMRWNSTNSTNLECMGDKVSVDTTLIMDLINKSLLPFF